MFILLQQATNLQLVGDGSCKAAGAPLAAAKTLASVYKSVSVSACDAQCSSQTLCIGRSYAFAHGVCNLHAVSEASLLALQAASPGWAIYDNPSKCKSDCHIVQAQIDKKNAKTAGRLKICFFFTKNCFFQYSG